METKYIKIAETKLGFEKCFPYTQWGDGSARWLKGGGLWDSFDVVAFVKHKLTFDKSLQN
jgi:hypothetical protein